MAFEELAAAQIQGRLADRGIDAGRAEVKDVLSNKPVDQQAIYEDERSKYSYEIWDKDSPINGVPADEVLQRERVRSSTEIYLVRDENGRIVYFQYMDPISGGYMQSQSEADSAASSHIDDHAEQKAHQRIVKQTAKGL